MFLSHHYLKSALGLALAAAVSATCGCSPIAPSMNKGQLVDQSHTSSPETVAPSGNKATPETPADTMADIVVYRSQNNSWVFAGSDARDWFSLSQPKNGSETDLSDNLLSEQFHDFLNNGETEVPISMSVLRGAPMSALTYSVSFEIKIDPHALTPDQLSQFNVTVTPGTPGDDGTLYWHLALPSSVPDEVLKPFLAGLTQITVMTSCSTASKSLPAAGNPCGGK